ncbi:MAG: RNA methyltransferase [Deltaproteobacteria bacterium]|nr:RNA methyltransferase [Deltaproteobacteria bacterium]
MLSERIETPSKAQLKRWQKLAMEKYRRREGLFLAEGEKVVCELLRSGLPFEAILMAEGDHERLEGIVASVPSDVPVFRLTDRAWADLSQDPSPEGIMAVAAMVPSVDPSALLDSATGPLLLLHQVNNPNNLGALLRTAHWFGFRTVLVGKGSCDATNPKAVRTSMGSLFHLNVIGDLDFDQILPMLRKRFRIVGSDVREGIAPHPCGPQTALLVGSESHGLPKDLLAQTDERWRIPGVGGAESLSLPQAAAIMMYECTKG